MFVPKIAIIHSTSLSVQPVADAFARHWPSAKLMNVLDDSLSGDLARDGVLTPGMVARFVGLAQYAKTCGVNGILFTCSAFGPAIEEAARHVGLPTLKPNECMFDEALSLCAQLPGERTIGLLTTFAPAGKSMVEEMVHAAARRRQPVGIQSACATGAMEILHAGDPLVHDRMIVEAAASLVDCDVIMLGQFSMARAQKSVVDAIGKPVLTSPDSAVRRMKLLLPDSN